MTIGRPQIIPRNIRFNLSETPKRHWLDNDLIKTAMADSFAVGLPEGERFFIRAVKHYEKSIEDPELLDDIKRFSAQEAYHSREHAEYNKALSALGYDVETMEKTMLGGLTKVTSPIQCLAFTCAIEHLTTTMANSTLNYPDTFEQADPLYRKLWIWHTLEELEHSPVALDVYEHITKKIGMPAWKAYFFRVSIFNITLIQIMRGVIRNTALYAKTDGEKTGIRFWAKCFYLTYIRPGYCTRMLKYLFRYYLPGYKPANHLDPEQINKWAHWLQNETAEPNH